MREGAAGRAGVIQGDQAVEQPTQQIADWLEKLNLAQYAQRFAEKDIDVSVLRHLTDADLEKIGVSLGHRRKILAAIAELPGASPSKHEPAGGVEPKPQETAERRQVTVMFSDLVGSTALSTRMDPEDLREVISAYQQCVAETVQRFGGFVAKYMGDGVLVCFGYPQAHEDDAERAVRAALELVAVVGALKTHASLQTRVGIATGLVVVGDLIGSGASQEQAIVGETPNLDRRDRSIEQMLFEDAQRLAGTRHSRGGGRVAYRWGRIKGKIGFHGGKVRRASPACAQPRRP
jgi:class 3 adenylate cyclase